MIRLDDCPSVGVCSPDELGLVPEAAAYFDELPFREDRNLSESGCCKQENGQWFESQQLQCSSFNFNVDSP